jgi:hypothetical protein
MYERGTPWASYGAAIWASIFAVFHIVWAAGWYPLLNAEQARVAFAVPWKWGTMSRSPGCASSQSRSLLLL